MNDETKLATLHISTCLRHVMAIEAELTAYNERWLNIRHKNTPDPLTLTEISLIMQALKTERTGLYERIGWHVAHAAANGAVSVPLCFEEKTEVLP